MAVYKVIQDIEAEDKLFGPLGLRQLIYAAIVLLLGFLGFQLAVNVWWPLALPLLAPMGLFGLLATPFSKDQSSEVWLLAKVRFSLKPRRRIWDQDGMSELVTVTAPKKEERQLTDGLSQKEVKSRLSALASTLDSRGWAIKNINMNTYMQPSFALQGQSDRLVSSDMLPQQVPNYDITANDDILDMQNNPTAQHLSQMVQASTQAHYAQLTRQMQQAATGQAAPVPMQAWYTPATPTAAEAQLIKERHDAAQKQHTELNHLKKINPNTPQNTTQPSTPVAPPQLAHLAANNNLSVATIAKQANGHNDPSEVVISLR